MLKRHDIIPISLLATPWTAAYQAPPSMGFSRQEYWSGVPLPSPLFHYRNPNNPKYNTWVIHISNSIKYYVQKFQFTPMLKIIIPTGTLIILIPLIQLSNNSIIWINATTHSLLISLTSLLLKQFSDNTLNISLVFS